MKRLGAFGLGLLLALTTSACSSAGKAKAAGKTKRPRGLVRVYGPPDANGTPKEYFVPKHIRGTFAATPPADRDAAFADLSYRCAAAEVQRDKQISRYLFAHWAFFGSDLLSTAGAATAVGMSEGDSGANEEQLKLGALGLGGVALVTTGVLGFVKFEERIDSARRVLNDIRVAQGRARSEWTSADPKKKDELLRDMVMACAQNTHYYGAPEPTVAAAPVSTATPTPSPSPAPTP